MNCSVGMIQLQIEKHTFWWIPLANALLNLPVTSLPSVCPSWNSDLEGLSIFSSTGWIKFMVVSYNLKITSRSLKNKPSFKARTYKMQVFPSRPSIGSLLFTGEYTWWSRGVVCWITEVPLRLKCTWTAPGQMLAETCITWRTSQSWHLGSSHAVKKWYVLGYTSGIWWYMYM